MDKLLKVLTEAKPFIDTETFASSKDLYGEGLIDSFDIMIILDEINVAYKVNIGPSDFERDDFRTVTHIYNLIQRHINSI